MGGGSGSSTAAGGTEHAPANEARQYSADADPSTHHVLELFSLPTEAAALPDDQRFKLVRCEDFVCEKTQTLATRAQELGASLRAE